MVESDRRGSPRRDPSLDGRRPSGLHRLGLTGGSLPTGGRTLEVASLVDRPLAGGSRGGGEFWKPAPAPVRWEALAGKRAPADTPAARLIQMHGGSSAIHGDAPGYPPDRRGGRARARLMPPAPLPLSPPSPTRDLPRQRSSSRFVPRGLTPVLILLECGGSGRCGRKGPGQRGGGERCG